MSKKVTYIPTLQEYARKKKKQRLEFLDLSNCSYCDFFRSGLNVCLWGNSIKNVSALSSCPVTHRELQSNDHTDF